MLPSRSLPQVVAVGGGKKKEDSEEWIKPNVAVGQTVMYSKYSGTEFEVGGGGGGGGHVQHTAAGQISMYKATGEWGSGAG